MTPTGDLSSLARRGRGLAARESASPHAYVQRARVLDAFAVVVAEQGYESASINQIVARAGVSRATFYEFFQSREECFLAAFDSAVERMGALLLHAYSSEATWRDGLRAGLAGLLELLDADPTVGRLLVVEALTAGPRILQRRTEVLEELAAVVDRGAKDVPAALPPPPRLTAEAVVGGVFMVIHGRMFVDLADQPSLIELLGSLMSILVLPYAGAEVAAQELRRPQTRVRTDATIHDIERARRAGAHHRAGRAQPPPRIVEHGNVLGSLDMRLTYRTLRCLRYLARHPGASNRQIADGAGISDQGQISKLLTRITRLGLVRKRLAGRGRPNQWELTEVGTRVLAEIEDRTLRWETQR